jgi:hypothetical protein
MFVFFYVVCHRFQGRRHSMVFESMADLRNYIIYMYLQHVEIRDMGYPDVITLNPRSGLVLRGPVLPLAEPAGVCLLTSPSKDYAWTCRMGTLIEYTGYGPTNVRRE